MACREVSVQVSADPKGSSGAGDSSSELSQVGWKRLSLHVPEVTSLDVGCSRKGHDLW